MTYARFDSAKANTLLSLPFSTLLTLPISLHSAIREGLIALVRVVNSFDEISRKALASRSFSSRVDTEPELANELTTHQYI